MNKINLGNPSFRRNFFLSIFFFITIFPNAQQLSENPAVIIGEGTVVSVSGNSSEVTTGDSDTSKKQEVTKIYVVGNSALYGFENVKNVEIHHVTKTVDKVAGTDKSKSKNLVAKHLKTRAEIKKFPESKPKDFISGGENPWSILPGGTDSTMMKTVLVLKNHSVQQPVTFEIAPQFHDYISHFEDYDLRFYFDTVFFHCTRPPPHSVFS